MGYAPCFVNGGSDTIVIGGKRQFEIWDITTRSAKRVLDGTGGRMMQCACSVNNIMAIGSVDKMLRLFDVRSWDMIYSKKYEVDPVSLHLTADLKYLTLSGWYGEQCIVMNLNK